MLLLCAMCAAGNDCAAGWHLDISFEECDRLLAQPCTSVEYTAADFEECGGFLNKGSSSFYAASKLLPADVRRGTVMLYSFCP